MISHDEMASLRAELDQLKEIPRDQLTEAQSMRVDEIESLLLRCPTELLSEAAAMAVRKVKSESKQKEAERKGRVRKPNFGFGL